MIRLGNILRETGLFFCEKKASIYIKTKITEYLINILVTNYSLPGNTNELAELIQSNINSSIFAI